MQKKDVKISSTYWVTVSGKRARVRLTNESPYGGYDGLNIDTGRKVRVKTAGRLQREITDPAAPSTESQPEPEPADATEVQASTEATPEPEPEAEQEAEAEPELEANQEPEPETEPDAATTASTGHDTASDARTPDQEPKTVTTALNGPQTPPEEPPGSHEPEMASNATTAPDTEQDNPAPGQEPEALTEAPNAAERPLSKLTIEELRTKYVEVVGRTTSSNHRNYLIWKVKQAIKGKVPTGPRRQRATAATGPHKVLPLRLEENLVQQLDGARMRLGLKSRMEMIRSALRLYLDQQGEVDVAGLFAPEA